MISTCLLCRAPLEPRADGTQRHPEAELCMVRLTDRFGVSIDDDEPAVERPKSTIWLESFPLVETVLGETFTAAGVPRLGGVSSGSGWSSFAVWQRCPYAWKRRYIDRVTATVLSEPEARTIGTLVHTFLALFYTQIQVQRSLLPSYPLTPEGMYDALRVRANPTYVAEAWRVFMAYRLYYTHEHPKILPLAVEWDLKDPRSDESCRFDTVVFYAEPDGPRAPGTYIMEHKTSGRFDHDTLDGWANDGEVIGQVSNWQRLKLDRRFGPLKGVIVNLLGKQKEPKFHRTFVAPTSWQIEQHREDLRRQRGLIQLAKSTDSFPRHRNGCIGRFGRCDYYEHCAGVDLDP